MVRKKTKAKPNHEFSADIKGLISERQLAGIGAVILAFNNLESTFDQFVMTVTDLQGDLGWEVCARLNSLDAKIAVIKKGAADILQVDEHKQLLMLLGEPWFGKLRMVRNCLAHLRHLDVVTGIGLLRGHRESDFFKVLASEDVLNSAYALLITLHREISAIMTLALFLKKLSGLKPDDPVVEPLELSIVDCRTKIQQHRAYRLSLPPIPDFPSEADLLSAQAAYDQAQLAMTMQALGQWSQPFAKRKFSPAMWNSLGFIEPPLPMRDVESKPEVE